MLEKIAKLQILTVGLLIVITILLSTKTIVTTFSGNTIAVTGSAYEIVKSDKGSLSFNINVKRINKNEAYKALQSQIKIVEKYLADKGITSIEQKTVNGYYNYKRDEKTGAYTNIPESYNLSQPIRISSDNVEKIKNISNDITGLISQGIDINVYDVSYDYSKLPELKVSLLEKASLDAKARAESMLKATHNKVGNVQSIRMGVYQITPVDSTAVSDMGINDSSTIDKKVTAVANISYKVK
ncbi:SIMPL domain-containing protein [bacterium]|nr:SIMPL domain-containing protein [bacterium]